MTIRLFKDNGRWRFIACFSDGHAETFYFAAKVEI